jgi:hypothetical protein
MVESRVELDHEAVLHYLFCLWRDLQVAESETAIGSPGVKNCSACGAMLASWTDRKLKAFRLDMPAKHACAPALVVKAKSENREAGQGGPSPRRL